MPCMMCVRLCTKPCAYTHCVCIHSQATLFPLDGKIGSSLVCRLELFGHSVDVDLPSQAIWHKIKWLRINKGAYFFRLINTSGQHLQL